MNYSSDQIQHQSRVKGQCGNLTTITEQSPSSILHAEYPNIIDCITTHTLLHIIILHHNSTLIVTSSIEYSVTTLTVHSHKRVTITETMYNKCTSQFQNISLTCTHSFNNNNSDFVLCFKVGFCCLDDSHDHSKQSYGTGKDLDDQNLDEE